MDGIKCWYNTASQVLTAAPALHSLIIRNRVDATRILDFVFHIRGHLRKLILEHCSFTEDDTGLIDYIVALHPDLEGLSLDSCYPLSSASYCFIPRLKNLSELNLSNCQVYYGCVKLLETSVWLRAHMWENTPTNICIYIIDLYIIHLSEK